MMKMLMMLMCNDDENEEKVQTGEREFVVRGANDDHDDVDNFHDDDIGMEQQLPR